MSAGRTTLRGRRAWRAGVVALDQLTKALVRDGLALGERRDLVLGFDLVHVRNSGIAFGLLVRRRRDARRRHRASRCSRSSPSSSPTPARPLVWLPTGLLLGGALGNLIDRAREGLGDRLHQVPALAGVQRRRHRDHVRGDRADLCSRARAGGEERRRPRRRCRVS